MANGSRHGLYYVKETTYGVTPATPAFKPLRHTGTTLGMSKNTTQSEELRSDRQIADSRHGARQIGGDINIEFSYSSFDELLEAVLCGTWETNKPVTGTDRLKAGVVRRSFTIEREFGDMAAADEPYHRFTGAELNNFSLSITPDAIVTGSFSVVGKGQSTNSTKITGATYANASTGQVLDSFTGSLKEAGTTVADITEISLSLENGIEPRFVVGSKETIRPAIGRSKLSGQITAYFEDSRLINKFINEVESSIEFEMPDLAGNKYKFILPRIKFNGGQPDVSGEGPITLSMPFEALLDSTSATNITIERKAA